ANAEAAGAAAKDKITAATTGEEVAQALATGKADVENAYKSGDISDAKLKANGHIDDAVAATKAKINADKRLPAAKKAAQIADAENRGAAAKSKIKAATTGDEVAQALAAGETDVANAYVEGTVDDAKQTAKEEIDNAVTDCKNLISSDSDLDSGSKTTQTAAAVAAGTAAKNNIDSATSFEEVDKALEDGKAAIAAAYQPGNLDNAKATAKRDIDAEVARVQGQIDADPYLSAAKKEKQKDRAKSLGETVKSNIDSATSGDGVAQALNMGKTLISTAYEKGELPEGRENAKQEIADEATKVKGRIDADSLLTTADKAKQKQDVDNAVAEANAAIDAATTPEEIAKAVADGKVKINAAYVPGKDLTEQKAIAKGNIASQASIVKGSIDADQNLTTATKEEQKKNVDQAVTEANAAIDAATTPDEIAKAEADGIAKINAAYVPGKDLTDQKNSAKGEIANTATDVKNRINADDNLSTDEKNKQKQDVDNAVAEANAAIDAATTPDEIAKAVEDGKAKINAAYVAGKDLSTQKNNAKQEIADEAKSVKDKIDADQNLTTAEKNKQKQDVDQAVTEANTAIDTAITPDGIVQATTEGKNKINAAYVPGKDLTDQKADANKEIDKTASDVKDKIDADKNLTTDEKNKQKQDVDKAASEAKDAINAATTPDEIAKAEADGKDKINGAYQPGKDLSSQKNNAKQEIANEAKRVKDRIDADSLLTTATKEEQKNNVDQAVAEANAAIDAATTPDEIAKAEQDGKDKINAAYVPGKDLTEQKADANKEIDKTANDVKDKIDADKNLTADEKNKQKQDVDKAASEAKDAINAATTPDEIAKAEQDGKDKINAAYVPGKDLTEQKADANKEI
ncbi:DUF1542 domain-containing protein, partial [Lactobacillus sp. M0390]|uniref:DUF1542 domain-containing protein n=1 Tax=Lactobacillus sp. M0390 TaxID=2751026 RepID=UPI0018DE40CA